MVVVGDGRSGDPLHERDDKRDVYEGEIAKVDLVSELVRRVDGVVDGTRAACVRGKGRSGRVPVDDGRRRCVRCGVDLNFSLAMLESAGAVLARNGAQAAQLATKAWSAM